MKYLKAPPHGIRMTIFHPEAHSDLGNTAGRRKRLPGPNPGPFEPTTPKPRNSSGADSYGIPFKLNWQRPLLGQALIPPTPIRGLAQVGATKSPVSSAGS